MVEDDLENVFAFHGYYASHPAPPALSAQQWDKQLGRVQRNVGLSLIPMSEFISL
jgi:hypothetical protein